MSDEGSRHHRQEDFRFIRGRGRYAGDKRFPDMVHAAFVRAPIARGRITGIDLEEARRQPEVLAIFTAADVPHASPVSRLERPARDPSGAEDIASTPRPLLAGDEVRHLGEPLAMVIARTPQHAADAAERVDLSFEEMPPVLTCAAAAATGAPCIWPHLAGNAAFRWRAGDAAAVEAAFASAPVLVTHEFAISRVFAAPLEPRSAVALEDEAGSLVLHASHQSPYELPALIAAALQVDAHHVSVVVDDVGGSFGLKGGLFREEALLLWAAGRMHRPIAWSSARAESFVADDHGRDVVATCALATDAAGRFLALRASVDFNVGAYVSQRSLASLYNLGGIAGVYRIPAISVEARGWLTNTVPTAPYRGAGRPEATYLIERLIDVAAGKLGIAPFELRRRNLIPAEAMPFRTALTFTYDSGDFGGCMDRAAELAQFEGFPERREHSAARGKLRGIGVANAIEAAGGPFGNPRPDSARLRLDPEGKVVVTSGTMSTGQGLETVMRQLAADRLQIGIEQTRYEQGGSRQLPFGRGSGGSSALCVGGPALLKAADMLIEKARALASITLEVSASDIDYGEGVFRVVGTDRVLGLADLARLAPCSGSHAASEQRLSAVAEFTPPAVTFPNGCHICELEVDPETGKVDVLAYVAVEDVGTVVNPTLLKGQIQGGIAQGLGQALKERIVYDDAGQLLSGSFTDYALPLAEDLPSFILESRPVPTKVNALGAKGAGEAGTVGSLAAAMNAVCNALAPHAIVDLPMPAAPSSIWKAIRAASQRT